MGLGVQCGALVTLLAGKRPCTHFIADWVGLKSGLDGCGKSRPHWVFDPRTFLPVASRYTV